jgi:hypothetical protein
MSSEELQEELKRVKRENKALREANRVLLEELEESQVCQCQAMRAAAARCPSMAYYTLQLLTRRQNPGSLPAIFDHHEFFA